MAIEATINYWAVLVSAVASMVLGSLWYGPLFGKMWMGLMGITRKQMQEGKKKSMTGTWIAAFVSTLVMAYVLSHFVDYLGAVDLNGALQLAFWMWLGFVATVQLGSVLWEGRPVKLYILNSVYYLVNLSVISVILTLWA